MSDIFRNGWHPKGKEGGKESWRGDFKGINQVAGWVGKGKGSGETAASTHIARPLGSLKDPSSFGAPPKNVNYHGGAALPNEITPHRGGLGAPLTQEQIESARMATTSPSAQKEAEQSQKPGPPPLPYRADRTGLKTDNLPPPPKHQALGESSPVTTPTASKPSPHLPPRLPARQNTATPPPPPSYEHATNTIANQTSAGFLNQSAINRLGNAGVSVPAFGIGKTSSNNDTTNNNTSSSALSGLQNRFAQMNTSNTKISSTETTAQPQSQAQPEPQPQPQAPSWQQTRQALTTANSAYKDPSSVSLADAQNAAQTAQNAQRSAAAFRERNQETINAAQTRATQINKKYNMTGRLNKWLEDANTAHDKQEQAVTTQVDGQQQPGQQPVQSPPPPSQQQQPPPQQLQGQQPVLSPPPPSSTPELAASISRKPPPPPPPKKPASMQAPPPVPLGTKPSFG